MTWTLSNAFPTKITVTDMKADGNEVAVESIELAYEGLKLTKLSKQAGTPGAIRRERPTLHKKKTKCRITRSGYYPPAGYYFDVFVEGVTGNE